MSEEGIGGVTAPAVQSPLVTSKVHEFSRIESLFVRSFTYVQAVQGQQRFTTFPIDATVRYLHALWMCHVKDCLLDVPHRVDRYDGPRALRVLAAWQDGSIPEVVDFLEARLVARSIADVTRQIAEQTGRESEGVIARLEHGRRVLLNRGLTLMLALNAVCSPSANESMHKARIAVKRLGYTPEMFARELEKVDSPLFQHRRHPSLARRNMLVMNRLGEHVTSALVDRPGHRTQRVEIPTVPAGPYAQEVIVGEIEITPWPYSTEAYFPATVAELVWLNGPSETAREVDATGEITVYPDMSACPPGVDGRVMQSDEVVMTDSTPD